MPFFSRTPRDKWNGPRARNWNDPGETWNDTQAVAKPPSQQQTPQPGYWIQYLVPNRPTNGLTTGLEGPQTQIQPSLPTTSAPTSDAVDTTEVSWDAINRAGRVPSTQTGQRHSQPTQPFSYSCSRIQSGISWVPATQIGITQFPNQFTSPAPVNYYGIDGINQPGGNQFPYQMFPPAPPLLSPQLNDTSVETTNVNEGVHHEDQASVPTPSRLNKAPDGDTVEKSEAKTTRNADQRQVILKDAPMIEDYTQLGTFWIWFQSQRYSFKRGKEERGLARGRIPSKAWGVSWCLPKGRLSRCQRELNVCFRVVHHKKRNLPNDADFQIPTTYMSDGIEFWKFWPVLERFPYDQCISTNKEFKDKLWPPNTRDQHSFVVVGIFFSDDTDIASEKCLLIPEPKDLFTQLFYTIAKLRGLRFFFSLKDVKAFGIYECPGIAAGAHIRPKLSEHDHKILAQLAKVYKSWGRRAEVGTEWTNWIHDNLNHDSYNSLFEYESPTEYYHADHPLLSLEVIMGWSPIRIGLVVLFPVVVSLAVGLWLQSKNWTDLATAQTAWGVASYIVTSGGVVAALLAILSQIGERSSVDT